MTPPARASLKDRVLEAVFGKQGTPAEQALAKAARPPRNIRTAYAFLHGASACSVLALFLWSHAWLPFVESRISSMWFWSAFGLNVLLRFVWEEISKRYEQRAKARLVESV